MSRRQAASKRIGGPTEVYPTPPWCVEVFLHSFQPPPGLWVEPCAGGLNLPFTVYSSKYTNYSQKHHRWLAYEVDLVQYNSGRLRCLHERKKRPAVDYTHTDFLSLTEPNPEVTWVCTNPPFTLAETFIYKCRELYPKAVISMLLRSGFLESEARNDLFNWKIGPGIPDLYALTNRPSYVGKGNDATSYAWFTWPVVPRNYGHVFRCKSASREERLGQKRFTRRNPGEPILVEEIEGEEFCVD